MADHEGGSGMRWAISAAISVALSGCGPSQAEIDAERDKLVKACQAAHDLKVAERRAGCDTARRSAEVEEREIKQRVLDGVEEVARQGGNGELLGATGWSIAIKDLSRNQWRWTEREADILADGYAALATLDTFEFTVKPADLDIAFQTTTYRDWPAVEMRCRDGKACIRVRGVTEVGESINDQTRRMQIDEQRTDNLWPIPSNSGSGRVAQALSELVKIQARSEPDVCTPLPEPVC